MKIFFAFLVSSLACVLAFWIAHSLGLPKFTLSGFLMVVSGGYLVSAVFDFFLMIVPALLGFMIAREVRAPGYAPEWVLWLAYFFSGWTAYLLIVQFTGLPLIGPLKWIVDDSPWSFAGGLYFFSSRWQAIAPSLGSGFLAGLFSIFAYRKTHTNPKVKWVLAFTATLPLWLGWLIPLSLDFNDIAWTHLPFE